MRAVKGFRVSEEERAPWIGTREHRVQGSHGGIVAVEVPEPYGVVRSQVAGEHRGERRRSRAGAGRATPPARPSARPPRVARARRRRSRRTEDRRWRTSLPRRSGDSHDLRVRRARRGSAASTGSGRATLDRLHADQHRHRVVGRPRPPEPPSETAVPATRRRSTRGVPGRPRRRTSSTSGRSRTSRWPDASVDAREDGEARDRAGRRARRRHDATRPMDVRATACARALRIGLDRAVAACEPARVARHDRLQIAFDVGELDGRGGRACRPPAAHRARPGCSSYVPASS